jgi:hypothetical protein
MCQPTKLITQLKHFFLIWHETCATTSQIILLLLNFININYNNITAVRTSEVGETLAPYITQGPEISGHSVASAVNVALLLRYILLLQCVQ